MANRTNETASKATWEFFRSWFTISVGISLLVFLGVLGFYADLWFFLIAILVISLAKKIQPIVEEKSVLKQIITGVILTSVVCGICFAVAKAIADFIFSGALDGI